MEKFCSPLKGKGFVASYQRRLPTLMEQAVELTTSFLGEEVRHMFLESERFMDLWNYGGPQHRQFLPRQWGIPSC